MELKNVVFVPTLIQKNNLAKCLLIKKVSVYLYYKRFKAGNFGRWFTHYF